MTKKVIRLTESDLHKIVNESVKKIMNEGIFRDENVDRLIEEFDELKNDAQYWKEVCVVKKDEKESLAILSGVIGKFEEIGQLLAAMNKSAGFATRFNNKYQYVRRRLENCAKALPYLKNIVKYKKSYEAPDWLRLIVNTLTDPAYQVIRESKRRILKEGFAEKYDHATEIIDYFANMLDENPNHKLSPKQKEQVANALSFLQETDTYENPNTPDWIELAQNLLK